jgi:hypothetical protein
MNRFIAYAYFGRSCQTPTIQNQPRIRTTTCSTACLISVRASFAKPTSPSSREISFSTSRKTMTSHWQASWGIAATATTTPTPAAVSTRTSETTTTAKATTSVPTATPGTTPSPTARQQWGINSNNDKSGNSKPEPRYIHRGSAMTPARYSRLSTGISSSGDGTQRQM